MKTDVGLEFLPNDGGEGEGLSEAGIETFRDNPFAAVARETGQNSRDARNDSGKPVLIKFDMLPMSTNDFCSIGEFRDAVQRCLEKAEQRLGEKEVGFFKQAKRMLSEPTIKILRISDFNTNGVRGPCEEGKPFYTLAKTDGISVKEEASSGGSFGIGKNAVFAISDIQTAFFSTRYKDTEGEHVLCMGKTLLISHVGADGKEKRRKGYWGKRGYLPLDSEQDIPDWLRRQEQGTSIFSVCMRDDVSDWRHEMTVAILLNFFAAIARKEMEFEIDEDIKINSTTIQSLFNDNKVIETAHEMNAQGSFGAARKLLQCLTDHQTIAHDLDVEGLGKVRMHILLRDGLEYTLGIIRNGMYITDNLKHFNESFKRFPLHRHFAIVIEPIGDHESEWFKRLENPRHDSLSAERITDPILRAQGQKAFKELAGAIRAVIRAYAKGEPQSIQELEELNPFFVSDNVKRDDDEGPETNPESTSPTPIVPSLPRPKTPPRKVYKNSGDTSPSPGSFQGPSSRQDPEPHSVPPGPEPRPQPVARIISLNDERNIVPDKSLLQKRRLYFTPSESGLLSLTVQASGLTDPEDLEIANASAGKLHGGTVEIPCIQGERVILDLEFEDIYTGPIELTGTLISLQEDANENQ